MIVLKTNPVGIDGAIQVLQQALYAYLTDKWDVSDYACYGRAYKTQKVKEDGFIPEVFIGGKDYREVYLNDKISALSYFIYERNTFQLINTAPVSLIFSVDITKLKLFINHRADEEVRCDIANFIYDYVGGGTQQISTVTGLNNVFSEFTGWRNNDSMKHRDMQPFHSFRINFNLQYSSIPNCITN